MLKIIKILFLKKFFDVDIYVYVGLIGWVFIFIIYIVKDLIWVKLFLRSFFYWRKLVFFDEGYRERNVCNIKWFVIIWW